MSRPPKIPATPRERALNLLARREQSQRELKRKLVQRGVDAADADGTVQALAGAHLQSDDRFAGMMVRRRIQDGFGPMRISAELASHGIARDQIREALDEENPDWLQLARRVFERKYAQRPAQDYQERMKRAAWLAQRGFPGDLARRVSEFDDSAE